MLKRDKILEMQFLDNIGENRLGDALAESLDEGSKLSIISSYFTVFAYGELKEELSSCMARSRGM